MNIIQYPLNKKQWIATKVKKTHIVWHTTLDRTQYTPVAGKPGRSTSVIDNWNNSADKHALCYVIDRNGEVYQTYPDDEWSYHTILPHHFDKVSIPVALANEGPLIIQNFRYYAFQRAHHTTEYFGPVIKKNWNGFQYWADYSDVQVKTLIALTKQLCGKHKIDYNPNLDSTTWNPKVWETNTVFAHSAVKQYVNDMLITEKWNNECT